MTNSTTPLLNPSSINHIFSFLMLLIILPGLIGNSFIIYASTRFSTLSMEAVTIYFVRHLAYADLLMVALLGLPILITHATQEWVLGQLGCEICAYLFSIIPNATLNFTAIVGVHRLLRCTYPQRLHVFTKRHAIIASYFTWFISTIPGVSKLGYMQHATFLPAWASCYFNLTGTDYPVPLRTVSISFMAVPSLILLTANIFLISLSCVKRRQNPAQTKSNKTVYLISLLYFFSWIPFNISDRYQRSPDQNIPIWAHNLLNHFYLIRNVGNPVIYCVVHKKFQTFTLKLLHKYFPCLPIKNRRIVVGQARKRRQERLETVIENQQFQNSSLGVIDKLPDSLSTSENILSTSVSENRLTTISENIPSTTENILTASENSTTTSENRLSTSENRLTISDNILSTSENIVNPNVSRESRFVSGEEIKHKLGPGNVYIG